MEWEPNARPYILMGDDFADRSDAQSKFGSYVNSDR